MEYRCTWQAREMPLASCATLLPQEGVRDRNRDGIEAADLAPRARFDSSSIPVANTLLNCGNIRSKIHIFEPKSFHAKVASEQDHAVHVVYAAHDRRVVRSHARLSSLFIQQNGSRLDLCEVQHGKVVMPIPIVVAPCTRGTSKRERPKLM
eukprot:gene3315-biopygen11966